MKHIHFLFFLLLLISCKNDTAFYKHELTESAYQFFEIDNERDTILRSKEGVTIHIKKNTFSDEGAIKLRFAAILSKADMIEHQMYTVDQDGGMLESGGMFQLQNMSSPDEPFNKAVRLEIPAEYVNNKMTKYTLANPAEGLAWTNSGQDIDILHTKDMNRGKKLFNKHCTMCHDADLRKDLTGPALGNVHLHRSEEWLVQFTKNSGKLIAEGDLVANCLWFEWNKSVMPSYPSLSNQEIINIYKYIANESQKQKISRNEVSFTQTCDTTAIKTAESSGDRSQQHSHYSNPIYEIILPDAQWTNIDYLLKFETEITPIKLEMQTPYKDLTIMLSFQERNTVIPFETSKETPGTYQLLNFRNYEQITFPIGEKVNIIAHAGEPIKYFKVIEYTPKKQDNVIKLSLDIGSQKQFIQAIERL